jgi:hypothetical protein
MPPYTTPTLMSGYSLDQYGNPYLNGSPPPFGYTHNSVGTLLLQTGYALDGYANPYLIANGVPATGYTHGSLGNLVLAPGYSFVAGNPTLLTVGTTGGTCNSTIQPAGAFSCDNSGGANNNTWQPTTFAIPSLAHPGVVTNMMYDAFNLQVTMPVNYRNIGYVYTDTNNPPSYPTYMEMTLNNSSTAVFGGTGGGLISYQLPSVVATNSVNTYRRDIGSSIPMDLGADPVTGMMWGRWAGGAFLQTQLAAASTTVPQTGSLHWFSTGQQNQSVTLPITGTWSYTLVGNTTPTDNAGTSGVLNSASFSANFTAQTVDVGVNVSMPASPANSALPVTLNATAVSVPILVGGNFKTTTPTITCTAGTCGANSGVIGGQFSAPNGAGVGLGYGLRNGTQTINGVAVFRH